MSIAAYKDCVNLEPGQAQGTAPTILNEEMVMDEHIVYGRGSALCLPWLSGILLADANML